MSQRFSSVVLAVVGTLSCSGSSATSTEATGLQPFHSKQNRPHQTKRADHITGVVVGEDGQPIANAVVAIIRHGDQSMRPANHGGSNAEGRFALAVEPGTYGATATASSKTAGFRCGIVVDGKTSSRFGSLAIAAGVLVRSPPSSFAR